MANKKKGCFNSDMFKKLLKNSGIKMNFIADKLEVSRISVSAWKSGFHDPSLIHINELARLFGVDVSILLKKSTGDRK